jgi:hypothetical protein
VLQTCNRFNPDGPPVIRICSKNIVHVIHVVSPPKKRLRRNHEQNIPCRERKLFKTAHSEPARVCSMFTICVPNLTAWAQGFGAKWLIRVSGLAHANFCHTCCARAHSHRNNSLHSDSRDFGRLLV